MVVTYTAVFTKFFFLQKWLVLSFVDELAILVGDERLRGYRVSPVVTKSYCG
jgi:hypothetical protein